VLRCGHFRLVYNICHDGYRNAPFHQDTSWRFVSFLAKDRRGSGGLREERLNRWRELGAPVPQQKVEKSRYSVHIPGCEDRRTPAIDQTSENFSSSIFEKHIAFHWSIHAVPLIRGRLGIHGRGCLIKYNI
jgi:hypothetical protein